MASGCFQLPEGYLRITAINNKSLVRPKVHDILDINGRDFAELLRDNPGCNFKQLLTAFPRPVKFGFRGAKTKKASNTKNYADEPDERDQYLKEVFQQNEAEKQSKDQERIVNRLPLAQIKQKNRQRQAQEPQGSYIHTEEEKKNLLEFQQSHLKQHQQQKKQPQKNTGYEALPLCIELLSDDDE